MAERNEELNGTSLITSFHVSFNSIFTHIIFLIQKWICDNVGLIVSMMFYSFAELVYAYTGYSSNRVHLCASIFIFFLRSEGTPMREARHVLNDSLQKLFHMKQRKISAMEDQTIS